MHTQYAHESGLFKGTRRAVGEKKLRTWQRMQLSRPNDRWESLAQCLGKLIIRTTLKRYIDSEPSALVRG